MKTKQSSAKTARLALNFTTEERQLLDRTRVQSKADSDSKVMREAFHLHANLFARVCAQEDIVLRSPDDECDQGIFIPCGRTKLDDPEGRDGYARQVLYIRASSELCAQVDYLVSQGAAPTKTLLAGIALGIYAKVCSRTRAGWKLVAKGGTSESVLLSDGTPVPSQAVTIPRSARSASEQTGFSPVPVKNILEVLEEEATLRPKRFVVDAPILTPDRHPDVARKVIDAVVANLKWGAFYDYILDEQGDEERLARWVQSEIAPRVRWDDIVPEMRAKVEALRSRIHGKTPRRWAEESPAWCLMRADTFPDEMLEHKRGRRHGNQLDDMLARMFNFPCWYAEMPDGRLWGYQFTSSGKCEPEETLLTTMHPKTISEQFEKLKLYGQDKLLLPEPLANVVVFEFDEHPASAAAPSPKKALG